MLVQLPEDIRRDVETTIRLRMNESRVVDVYATAAEIRRKHAGGDAALDDIANCVARLATQCGCAIEFGQARLGQPAST